MLTGQLVKSSFLLRRWAIQLLTSSMTKLSHTMFQIQTRHLRLQQESLVVKTRMVPSQHLTGVTQHLQVHLHLLSTRIFLLMQKLHRLKLQSSRLLTNISQQKTSRVTVFLTSTTVLDTTILTTLILQS